MKVLAVIALLVILLSVVLPAQEIQVKKVMDFSGGLVNSISNAAMRDNMAVVLKDYDIDPFGNLKRRQGMKSFGGGLSQVLGIVPYVTNEQKDLMILTIDTSYCNITRCELYADTSRCTTNVGSYYYDPSYDWTVPFNASSFIFHETLYFAETNSDMFYWGGDSIITVRPFETSQIRGVPINAHNSLKGRYSYVYEQRHIDTSWSGSFWQWRDTIVTGIVSWPVFPHYGSVLLWGFPLDTLPDAVGGDGWTSGQRDPADSVYLYRRDSETDSLLLVAGWPTLDSNITFEDTVFIADSTDTLFSSLPLGPPDSVCEESLLSFQPDYAVLHGERVYAIGNPEYPNRLYYSTFGRPTNWPCSNYIEISSRQSDWLVHLLPLEDRLILFRHNSVLQLTGHTFYQYSIDELASHVGVSAPRSVVTAGNSVYFFHSPGVYTLSQFGGVSVDPISFQIEKSIDSFRYCGPPTYSQQRAVGASVNDEYWLSFDFAGSKQGTYIYSEFPIPHWRSYGFGFQQMVRFDTDTTSGTFNPNRWLVARIGDPTVGPRLWTLEMDHYYSFVNVDTMDVYISNVPDTTYYEIEAVYQSKRFFEGRERERVYWLDIIGEGNADTITFTFLDEGVAFGTVKYLPDFTDGIRDRIVVDHIVSDFSVRWQDNGYGQYTIKGYEIGWIPWDRGRPVP